MHNDVDVFLDQYNTTVIKSKWSACNWGDYVCMYVLSLRVRITLWGVFLYYCPARYCPCYWFVWQSDYYFFWGGVCYILGAHQSACLLLKSTCFGDIPTQAVNQSTLQSAEFRLNHLDQLKPILDWLKSILADLSYADWLKPLCYSKVYVYLAPATTCHDHQVLV